MPIKLLLKHAALLLSEAFNRPSSNSKTFPSSKDKEFIDPLSSKAVEVDEREQLKPSTLTLTLWAHIEIRFGMFWHQ